MNEFELGRIIESLSQRVTALEASRASDCCKSEGVQVFAQATKTNDNELRWDWGRFNSDECVCVRASLIVKSNGDYVFESTQHNTSSAFDPQGGDDHQLEVAAYATPPGQEFQIAIWDITPSRFCARNKFSPLDANGNSTSLESLFDRIRTASVRLRCTTG